jgi:hypothetical protein
MLHSLSTVSQSHPYTTCSKYRKIHRHDALCRYHTGEYSYPSTLYIRDPLADCLRLQLHSAWVPEQSVCGVLNTESGNKAVIATLVTDVVLLLTMLVGLLRLRQHGTMFALGQLLWNQVNCVTPCPI